MFESKLSYLAALVASLLTFLGNAALAIPLTLDSLRETNTSFYSMTYDVTTGTYYSRNNFRPQSMDSYADINAFRTGNTNGTLNLSGGYYGTYVSANNGVLSGRATSNTNAANQWDLTTGNIVNSTMLTDHGAINGTDTFDWGGFSSLNFMQSNGYSYVLSGRAAGPGSLIQRVDENLGILSTINIAGAGYGYGFVINDFLFLSDNFNSDLINTRVNLSTGATTAVDFTLDHGLTGNRYWSNALYDGSSDSLFFHDTNSSTLFELAGAAGVLGVAVAPVPAPGSLGLVGLGVLCLALTRRQRERNNRIH